MKLYAEPGDPDLDFDVDGVTLVSVVVQDREILFRAEGGFGEWTNIEGERTVFEPGAEHGGVHEIEGRLWFPNAKQSMFDLVVERMERWRDNAVPLRMCGAPGKLFTLIEDNDSFLLLPRNSDKGWVDE